MASTLAPKRYIFTDGDLERFLASPAKKELLGFVGTMGRSCSSSSFRFDPENPLEGLSPPIAALFGALESIRAWVADIPPCKSTVVRFGNPAFRSWHSRLQERSVSLVLQILTFARQDSEDIDAPPSLSEAETKGKDAAGKVVPLESIADDELRAIVAELSTYLQASFGSSARLDFGTGHECSFQIFLFCLCKCGCFAPSKTNQPTPESLKAITLSIWSQYLKITRVLQRDYMLEPAGSHGVWGLDDYHCLPFYFGACQLMSTEEDYDPSSIHDKGILQEHSETFLYFGCIDYIQTLKKGVPFFEHSPMLNDISQLASWEKVARGLLRLFEGEVLSKRQVVQHLEFGNLFTANWTANEPRGEPPLEGFRTTPNSAAIPPAFQIDSKAPWAK